MTLEELQAINDELTQRVQQLESINSDLVSQKKELKEKIRNGIDDEELKNELDNYKNKYEATQKEMSNLKNDYTRSVVQAKAEATLHRMGIDFPNDYAKKLALDELSKGATIDETTGSVVFTDENGITKYNDRNQPYSLDDAYIDFRSSDAAILLGDNNKQPSSIPTANVRSVDANYQNAVDKVRSIFEI